MSISPDYTQYIDLTLYDKDAQDILDAAQTTLQSRIPDWVPASTNIEVMLMEAMALEVSETVFSVNRLPVTMIRALLALYGVAQDPGAPPTVDLEFTAYDTDGYAIPAGTEVSILTASGTYISFFTDADGIVAGGGTTGVIPATATEYTNIANGLPAGTPCVLIDAITGIQSVATDTIVVGGVLPETEAAWTERGVQRLQRLVDTLVIPAHFTAAALEDTNVFRANTIDNWDGTGVAATYTWAGNVVTVTMVGHGLATSDTVTVDFTSGSGTPDGTYTVASTPTADTFTFALTGSGTGGNMTVWKAVGEDPGNVTVVVYGSGAALSAPQKAALLADLEARSAANLLIHIIDPTVTTVAVTAAIKVKTGYSSTTVIDAVEARLAAYLSPTSWPWSGTVRRFELVSVIDQVEGVDYVDSLTTPAADVTLSSGSTLATAGTLTITAV